YTLLALDGLVRCFRLYYLADQRTLHSLPTRRSSDLPRQSRHGAGEVQCLFRQYSGFLRFTADIDLHQNVQIRHGIRALLAEATGNFVAVDGFHPVKMPGHQARFIGLQRADKMPFNIAQMRQRSNFFQTVLYIIFTKSALAQPVDGLYLSGGFGFTDRQQAYTGGVALMVAAGLLQSLLHSLIVLFSAWHG